MVLSCDQVAAFASADMSLEAKLSGGILGERWRWRVLSAVLLPHCSRRGEVIAPEQASQLRVRLPLGCNSCILSCASPALSV
jgi:hypothetical protein